MDGSCHHGFAYKLMNDTFMKKKESYEKKSKTTSIIIIIKRGISISTQIAYIHYPYFIWKLVVFLVTNGRGILLLLLFLLSNAIFSIDFFPFCRYDLLCVSLRVIHFKVAHVLNFRFKIPADFIYSPPLSSSSTTSSPPSPLVISNW